MKKITLFLIFVFSITALFAVPEHKPGEVIVKFENSFRGSIEFESSEGKIVSCIQALDNVFNSYNFTDFEQLIPDYDHLRNIDYGLDLIYVFHSENDIDAINSIGDFEKLSFVEFAELNLKMIHCNRVVQTGWEPYYTPNDPMFSSQWFLPRIQASEAWDLHQSSGLTQVGIVDDGCEKDHEDLQANYVTGYDYVSGDPDPTPPTTAEDHGTHCSGLAAAVTNNGVGISACSHNVGLIGVRTIYLSQCAQGISFCAQNGAEVISMSWGPGSYAIQSAINDAYNNYDVILFGAAGNDNTSTMHYPAAYTNVVAVAASNGSDFRANFSNYGTWIDITAPGTSMLSTVPFGNYTNMQGTSMSGPLAAGLAAYVRDMDGTIDNDSTKAIIMAGCDPMVNDSMYQAGMLGAGRINALRTIGKLGFTDLLPIYVNTTGPGGSFHILPGEIGSIEIHLVCDTSYNTATNVSVVASSSSGIITFNDNTSSFSNANPGDTVDNNSDLITFTVDGGVSPSFVNITFVIHSTPQSITDSFTTIFVAGGIPDIIVVNAEVAGNYVDNYTDPLDNLGYVYDTYNRWSDGPIGSLLNDYDMAIWYTGDATSNVITNDDINDITSYLNSGNDFFITGQNIAEDLQGNSFLSDYLRCTWVSNSTTSIHNSSSGSIFDGFDIVTAGGSPSNQTSRDVINTANSSIEAFIYQSSTDIAAIQYFGGYKLIFFGFGFEAINEVGPYVSRDTVMARILDWFEVGVQEDPVNNGHEITSASLAVQGSSVFAGRINFTASIPNGQIGNIFIYDMTGRRIITLVNGLEPGIHNISWNGNDRSGASVSGGNYIVKMISGNSSYTARILLVK